MNEVRYSRTEICRLTGLEEAILQAYIDREWITPEGHSQFDYQDMTRVQFIVQLEHDLGVNEQAIPIVLHLLDQLHYLRGRLKHAGLHELD